MALNYIDLEFVLHPEQKYVAEAAKSLGIDVRAVRHPNATDTCYEKAELIGWPAERIVKAMFFRRDRELYGFVFPELGTRESPQKIDPRVVIPKVTGEEIAGAVYRNGHIPYGMEKGTCTPFLLEGTFSGIEEMFGIDFKKVFVHDIPRLNDALVDISIGGEGDLAHKVSLHLPYSGIYSILRDRFPEWVERTVLF